MRVSPIQSSVKSVYKTHIDAIHFRKTDEKRLHGLDEEAEQKLFTEDRVQTLKELAAKPDVYERLSAALAPSIYEHEDIKKVQRSLFSYSVTDKIIITIHSLTIFNSEFSPETFADLIYGATNKWNSFKQNAAAVWDRNFILWVLKMINEDINLQFIFKLKCPSTISVSVSSGAN